MNLGIGVCMGDVSFTNRPYSTSIGNTAQYVVENKSKGRSRKEPNNKKDHLVFMTVRLTDGLLACNQSDAFPRTSI